MKKIVFTSAANNFLGYAATLGDSIQRTNPEVFFTIVLVDEPDPTLDYSSLSRFNLINYNDITCPNMQEMKNKYKLVEFITALKPFIFQQLFEVYGLDSRILFIDPDVCVYERLDDIFEALDKSTILLTPHITDPTEKVLNGEFGAIRAGIFNTGFVGLKYDKEAIRFLNWWQARLVEYCLRDFSRGIFVDQKWLDLVPCLFDSVGILKSKVYNMAWWNLSERKLIRKDNTYFVNSTEDKLVFLHFSSYSFTKDRYQKQALNEFLDIHPELSEIFYEYKSNLSKNDCLRFERCRPIIQLTQKQKKQARYNILQKVQIRINKIIKFMLYR